MMFLTGCSSKVPTKTVIVQPKAFTFTTIDVNLSEVKPTLPLRLDGKIHFLDDSHTTISMDVDTWIDIRNISRSKTKEVTLLRIHKSILSKAYISLIEQVKIYNELMGISSDCRDCKATLKDTNDTKIN